MKSEFYQNEDTIRESLNYFFQNVTNFIISCVKAISKLLKYFHQNVLPWSLLIGTSLFLAYLIYVGIASCFKSTPVDGDDDDEVVGEDLKIGYFKTFKRFESCSVCLESFEETSKLRILPCEHSFHVKCIDQWFKSDQTSCPICRQDVPSLKKAKAIRQYQLLNNYTLDPYDVVDNWLVCDECVETCKRVIQNREAEFSAQFETPTKVVLFIMERTRGYFAFSSREQLVYSNGVPRFAPSVLVLQMPATFLENCQYQCLQDSLEEYELQLAEKRRS